MQIRIRHHPELAIAAALAAATPAHAQLGGAGGALDTVADQVGQTVGGIVEPLGNEIEQRADAAGETVDAVLDDIDRIGAAATELFLGAEDPAGQDIEGDVWIVLVPGEFSNQIPGWGFSVRERRDLDGLDLILLRIDAPPDRGMTETELELNAGAPGTVVDFNHVYGPTQADATGALAGRAAAGAGQAATSVPPGALTLGLIDSAIAASHEAFSADTIVQRDFVAFQGERPREHGTAVASIALEALKSAASDRPLALLVASVFVAAEREQIATIDSLVAALGWLESQNVAVINMSLTGPENRVLEVALAAIARQGTIVVAAVGNEGPAGKPQYPAAYDTVIGITAVDDARRVYRRANRGPQVHFAAPGVRVRVARSDGGFRRETGTSMAAPVAAAVIASELAAGVNDIAAVLRQLEQGAVDLGDPGYDNVYGHGLIPVTR